MNDAYEEIIEGLPILRLPPGGRHEQVLRRLQVRVAAALQGSGIARLLPTRSPVPFPGDTLLRPDLTVLTVATGKPWLIAEVISAGDHHPDTVTKKDYYEDLRLPRLWMVDPRYDNVEVYHGTPHGLGLRGILAGRESLEERLLPGFQLAMVDLFST